MSALYAAYTPPHSRSGWPLGRGASGVGTAPDAGDTVLPRGSGVQQPGLGSLRHTQGPRPAMAQAQLSVPVGILAAAVAVVLITAYAHWLTTRDPVSIGDAAREVQRLFQDAAREFKKLGLHLKVPSLDQLTRKIYELFSNARAGLSKLADMASDLVDYFLRGSPPNPTDERMPHPHPVVPPVPDLALPEPLPLSERPIIKQQMALNQSGIANQQLANQTLDAGIALLPDLNGSLRQFYFDASGGAAARTQGALRPSIARVQEIKEVLSALVNESNEPVAGIKSAARSLQQIYGNPANAGQLFPDLAQVISGFNDAYQTRATLRNDFKSLVLRLDTWLGQAYRHAADGTEMLPVVPLPVLTPAGTDANAVARELLSAAQQAQQALDRSNALRSQPVPVTPAPTAGPTTPSDAATAAAPVNVGWADPATGRFSSQRIGPQSVLVKAQFVDALSGAGQRVTMNVEGEPVEVEVLGPEPESGGGGSTKNYYQIYISGGGGGGGGGVDWRNAVLAALSVVLPTILFAHGQAERDRVGNLQPDFSGADRQSALLLDRLGPNSTEGEAKDVREAIWRMYFDAANAELQEARWQRVLNIPGLGGGPMFSEQDMRAMRDEQAQFLDRLRTQPLPSRFGGDLGIGLFDRTPRFAGDEPLKAHHFNSVMQKVNGAVRQQLVLMPSRTADHPGIGTFSPRPFDVNTYVRDHPQELATEEGRRQAFVALWRHHLDQVLPAVGNARLTPEQVQAFRMESERWLNSPQLDPAQLVLLPGNTDVQPVLASAVAAARRDADRLLALVPRPPSALEQFLLTPEPTTPADTTDSPNPQAQPSPPSVSPAPLRNAQAVLDDVNQAIADARLNGPPQPEKLSEVRFTPDMFFEPGQPGQPRTAEAIDAAYVRARDLYDAISAIGESNRAYTASFIELLSAFNNDVLIPLVAMQDQFLEPR